MQPGNLNAKVAKKKHTKNRKESEFLLCPFFRDFAGFAVQQHERLYQSLTLFHYVDILTMSN